MNPAASVLLDLLRFSAACVVFLSHATAHQMTSALPWIHWGHEAVVVFFVISGFVIAYVVDTREGDLDNYVAARLGRLYSVVLPALALTFVLDSIGRPLAPELYAQAPADHVLARLLINGLFLQQCWNLTVMPLSNGPFWSLSFEFWYYCIFGAWTFAPPRWRLLLAALLCLCAGPRIVASLPIWLLGVFGYHLHRRLNLTSRWRHLLFATVVVAVSGILAYGNPLHGIAVAVLERHPDRYLDIAGLALYIGDIGSVPEDLLLGALIVLGLLVFHIEFDTAHPPAWVRAIRSVAGSTFALYLFHAPLLYLLYAVAQPAPDSALQALAAIVLIFGLCTLLSYFTERKVAVWRSGFARGIAMLRRGLG